MSSLITSPLLKTYTLQEFWQLPDPPDRSKLELIAGVLFMTPPPEYTHDNVVARLTRLLSESLIASRDRGKLYSPRAAIWTGPATYLEPDLFYVSADLEATMDPEHRSTADLVIEVLSPGSALYDRNTKAQTYGALGVRELWLVDQVSATMEVRTRTGNGFGPGIVFRRDEQVISSTFPSLILFVRQLFED